jgi:hypothetical protein
MRYACSPAIRLFCYATNVDYRLDTRAARAFLDDFIALP